MTTNQYFNLKVVCVFFFFLADNVTLDLSGGGGLASVWGAFAEDIALRKRSAVCLAAM